MPIAWAYPGTFKNPTHQGRYIYFALYGKLAAFWASSHRNVSNNSNLLRCDGGPVRQIPSSEDQRLPNGLGLIVVVNCQ